MEIVQAGNGNLRIPGESGVKTGHPGPGPSPAPTSASSARLAVACRACTGRREGTSVSTQGCEGRLDSRPRTQVNRFFQKNEKCVLITPVEHLCVN